MPRRNGPYVAACRRRNVTLRVIHRSIPGRSANAKSAQGFTKDQPSRRAHFVEFGTRKMKSEPFMLPAAEAIKAPYLARVLRSGKSIERDMSTVGGRFM